jgi:hypothetical protein
MLTAMGVYLHGRNRCYSLAIWISVSINLKFACALFFDTILQKRAGCVHAVFLPLKYINSSVRGPSIFKEHHKCCQVTRTPVWWGKVEYGRVKTRGASCMIEGKDAWPKLCDTGINAFILGSEKFSALSESGRTPHSFIYLRLTAPGTSTFRLLSPERKSWQPRYLLVHEIIHLAFVCASPLASVICSITKRILLCYSSSYI